MVVQCRYPERKKHKYNLYSFPDISKLLKLKICQYFILNFFITIFIPVHLSARIKLFRVRVVSLKYFAGAYDI